MYCSRKHAVATKVLATTDFGTLVPAPSEMNVYVNCDQPMRSSCSEMHNTYPYNPIFYKEMWFHSLFHVVAYTMCYKKEKLKAEFINSVLFCHWAQL